MDISDRLHNEEKMEILFLKDSSTGSYEPLLYDCKIIDGEYEGKRILPNSLFQIFKVQIGFIPFTQRKIYK